MMLGLGFAFGCMALLSAMNDAGRKWGEDSPWTLILFSLFIVFFFFGSAVEMVITGGES